MSVRRTSLRLAAASFCLLQFLIVEATAHVRVPDYDRLSRKIEPGNPGATGQGAAKPKHVCDASFGGSDLSVVSFRGAPDSMINDAELLSLLEDEGATPDIVQVAEGVSVDGTTCPLFVTLSTSRGEQTVWRFAPDDEPAGWFNEWGRRLGGAALDEPSRARACHRPSAAALLWPPVRRRFTMASTTSRVWESRSLRRPTASSSIRMVFRVWADREDPSRRAVHVALRPPVALRERPWRGFEDSQGRADRLHRHDRAIDRGPPALLDHRQRQVRRSCAVPGEERRSLPA